MDPAHIRITRCVEDLLAEVARFTQSVSRIRLIAINPNYDIHFTLNMVGEGIPLWDPAKPTQQILEFLKVWGGGAVIVRTQTEESDPLFESNCQEVRGGFLAWNTGVGFIPWDQHEIHKSFSSTLNGRISAIEPSTVFHAWPTLGKPASSLHGMATFHS